MVPGAWPAGEEEEEGEEEGPHSREGRAKQDEEEAQRESLRPDLSGFRPVRPTCRVQTGRGRTECGMRAPGCAPCVGLQLPRAVWRCRSSRHCCASPLAVLGCVQRPTHAHAVCCVALPLIPPPARSPLALFSCTQRPTLPGAVKRLRSQEAGRPLVRWTWRTWRGLHVCTRPHHHPPPTHMQLRCWRQRGLPIHPPPPPPPSHPHAAELLAYEEDEDLLAPADPEDAERARAAQQQAGQQQPADPAAAAAAAARHAAAVAARKARAQAGEGAAGLAVGGGACVSQPHHRPPQGSLLTPRLPLRHTLPLVSCPHFLVVPSTTHPLPTIALQTLISAWRGTLK